MTTGPDDGAKSPLLVRSKLEPPRVYGSSLDRSRIHKLLRTDKAAHVNLVFGPAGFGKSTVLRQVYLAQPDGHAAWLTLDAGDNDPGRLLFHLKAALGGADTEQTRRLESQTGNFSSVAKQLLELQNLLFELPKGFCLILDDVHALTTDRALEVLSQITENLPNHISIILGSRGIPDIPLGRLRMHGRLQEIDANTLRFTRTEVEEMLRCELPDKRISRTLVDHLWEATEGWVGAIQMAVLSLRSAGSHEDILLSFSGSNTELADYLAEDMLARLPTNVRRFLESTSVLDQLSAELCDDMLARDDSAEMLQHLSRANMFLFSYQTEASWFRYHNLFRTFLLERAEASGRERLRELRKRAAHWFAQNDRPSTAVSYGLASGDFEFAAELINDTVMDLFMSGHLPTIVDWVRPLPPEIRNRYPQVVIAYAWSLIALQIEPETITELVANLNSREDLSRELRNETIYIGPFHQALQDELERLDATCLAALDSDAEASPFARGVLLNIASYARIHKQDFTGAMTAARAARRAHIESGSAYGLGYSESFAGRVELASGRLSSARTQAEAASAIANENTGETAARVTAAALSIRLDYEAGNDAECRETIARYGSLIAQFAPPHEWIELHVIPANIAFDRGDHAEALRILNKLRQLARGRGHERAIATAWAIQSQIAARRNDIPGAKDYFEQARACDDLGKFGGSLLQETEALIAMMDGQLDKARDILESARRHGQAVGNMLAVMELDVLLIELHSQAGRSDKAEAAMAGLLDRVAREGIIRPLLRAPDAVRQEFSRFAIGKGSPLSRDMLNRIDPAYPGRVNQSARSELPIEPLSRRETEVLQEMAKGLSNREIADRLCISLPTVKTHLRNVNSKLLAVNRTEAAITARRLGLISNP